MPALTVILSLLSQLLSIVPAGTALYNTYVTQKAQVEQWAADGHVPTDAEWAALDASVKAHEAAIDTAAL